MNIEKGHRVLVNLAPFIGSARRSMQAIACEVLEVEAERVRVRAEPPYREVTLWVQARWIEGRPASSKRAELVSA